MHGGNFDLIRVFSLLLEVILVLLLLKLDADRLGVCVRTGITIVLIKAAVRVYGLLPDSTASELEAAFV